MFQSLLLLVGLLTFPVLATTGPPPMPPVVVLIVCKVKAIEGPADPNTQFTKHLNLTWDTTDAIMHCRREEVQMYDQAAGDGAAPQPFNQQRCSRSGLMLGPQWDAAHLSSNYRFWNIACPVAIVNKQPDGTETIIGWKLPECGHPDIVKCEVDSAI